MTKNFYSSMNFSENPYDIIPVEYKVVVVGNSHVGKSTFLYALYNNEFKQMESTIGVDTTKIIVSFEGRSLILNFFDTAGQEAYDSLSTFYLRGADCALVCFDPIYDDYISSINRWKSIIEDLDPTIALVAVAMKCDTWDELREIDNKYLAEIHNKCGISDIFKISSLRVDTFANLVFKICEKCITKGKTLLPSSFDPNLKNKILKDDTDNDSTNVRRKSMCGCAYF